MQDSTHILQEQITDAARENAALSILGGSSKSFYGNPVLGETVTTTIHNGIVEYEPSELTVTVRGGTSLAELTQELSSHGQMLACEPPGFSDDATIGGAIAAGLSGPARPYRSSIADIVLGCRIITGEGQILEYGGKVMKNVAGYDISRLMTGSLGCLGLILEITLRVIPAPERELTFSFSVESLESAVFVNELRKKGLPVSAASSIDGTLYVRFSGGADEISGLEKTLLKSFGFVEQNVQADNTLWVEIKNHSHAFFNLESESHKNLWRLSVAPGKNVSAFYPNDSARLTEWGGAILWFKSAAEPEIIHRMASQSDAQATLFRSCVNESMRRFAPVSPALQQWYTSLKSAFDPQGIFNPGRFHDWL